MTSDLALDEPAAIARLLELVLDDRSKGRERTDEGYTSRFPGHERAVQRELANLRGDEPDDLYVGGYRMVRELGRGGQGVVYLAEDPVLPRRIGTPKGVFRRR